MAKMINKEEHNARMLDEGQSLEEQKEPIEYRKELTLVIISEDKAKVDDFDLKVTEFIKKTSEKQIKESVPKEQYVRVHINGGYKEEK